MSIDLILKPSCVGCGSTTDLYGSNCKHLTLCSKCGKSMAENRAKCFECGTTLTRLIREYNVRASSGNDKNYFIGRFASGLPDFSKKKSAENKWTLQKEGLHGRANVNDSLREKFKNKPWTLEDETGQSQYHGQLEGSQSATYYLLMMQSKEFVAIPAGSWYNFTKVAQYKQLTLEEAEEKMKNRRKLFDGYERWMMKTASNGASAFPTFDPNIVKDIPAGGAGKGRKKATVEDEGNASDKGEDDPEEESERKERLGLNKKAGDNDDDDDGPARGDFDDEDDNIEKGDDWEHEEIFTDDDEAVGNDPEEREDLLAPELPAPPEIKQDDDDDDDANEEEGGLSKSGRELKKLLGRANGLNDSDPSEEDDSSGKKKKDEEDDDDDDEEDRPSPVLAPKIKDPKEEPADSSAPKPATGGSSRGTPASKSAKGKRKLADETKPVSASSQKKVKTENDVKTAAKETASKNGGVSKSTPPSSSKSGSSTQGTAALGPVSEEEIRAVLLQRAPVTTSDLVGNFKARLKSPEDKKAFAEILKRISKIQKSDKHSYIVLRG